MPDFRLDRLLVMQAFGSRTQVQQLIRRGQVTVDGVPALDPSSHVCPEKQAVLVNGQSIGYQTEYYLMMNKPAGVLTAARDKKQPTVQDILPEMYLSRLVMPVGRLDKDTTGILLFTSDGALGHFLLSPKRHVPKVYSATVDGPLTQDDVSAFAAGLHLGDFDTLPAELEILSSAPASSEARLTIGEGKFHQVKRMFESRGRTVTRLHRESFGGLALDESLPHGGWRNLTEDEIALLYRNAKMEDAQ